MTTALQVAYFVHGRGRGRAARSVPIVQRLIADGHRVTVHGGGDAANVLGHLPEWRDRRPLPLGRNALVGLPWRVATDIAAIGRDHPDLVISDGDQAALAAARARRIRTLAVGHDLVFSSCAVPESMHETARRFFRYRSAASTHLAEHRVAVHFLPIEATRDNTWVARPDGDADARVSSDGYFLAYFRDGNGAKVVNWLRAQGRDVRWFGPGATPANGSAGAFLDRESFQRELRQANGVVCSAGSNLLAECVLHGKPVLALYREEDTEHKLNAILASTAQVAISSTFDRVDAEMVERFAFQVDAREFRRIAIAEQLQPASEVISKLVAEMAW